MPRNSIHIDLTALEDHNYNTSFLWLASKEDKGNIVH